MTDPETRVCTDCQGVMGEIKLIDKGHYNTHSPVEYVATDSKPSIWTGKAAVVGVVKAFLCAECGLIKHYGVPKS